MTALRLIHTPQGLRCALPTARNMMSGKFPPTALRARLSWGVTTDRLTVEITDGMGDNPGLSEIEVFPTPDSAGDYVSLVDPMIETTRGRYFFFITGCGPQGMIGAAPMTRNKNRGGGGYNYNDSHILGFPQIHAWMLSGLTFMPACNGVEPWRGEERWQSAFSHTGESASPGYYGVVLADEGIRAELSATPRTGIHRYTYPEGAQERRLWVDVDRSMAKGCWGCHIIQAQLRQTAPDVVEGYRVITGWAKMRRVYFSIEFSQPVEIVELRDGDRVLTDGTTVINGTAPRGLFRVLGDGCDVVAKVGISPVSAAGARENRMAEAKGNDFGSYVAAADSLWDDALGRIEVTGEPERLTTFYTAMYHMMIQPNLFSDRNGEFMLPDYSTAKAPEGENRYTTFSLWDTYRAAHPFYTILFPELTRDFVNSMLDHYDAYGYLPIWLTAS